MADAQFVDPAHGDYRVKDGSPALALGFVNFPMDQFGVQKPELKAIARTFRNCRNRKARAPSAARAAAPATWLGASVRNIADEGEMSAFGLPGVTGVLVLEVPTESPWPKPGCERTMSFFPSTAATTADTAALLQRAAALPAGNSLKVGISRDQKEIFIALP